MADRNYPCHLADIIRIENCVYGLTKQDRQIVALLLGIGLSSPEVLYGLFRDCKQGVNPQQWDENLDGHAAVKIDRGEAGAIHVVRTLYGDGQESDGTECGLVIEDESIDMKEDIAAPDLDLCPKCWPTEVQD